jgi:hypothetical protein
VRVLSVFSAGKHEQIAPAINDAKESGAEARNVLATPFFTASQRTIFEHVVALRLPAIYQRGEMAEEGELIAYGPRIAEVYR